MLMESFYNTIERQGIAEFKERGSRFIAYAFPLPDAASFKARLEEVKKEHPKASHHCFAYRIGTEGNLFRTSDDGEPSGTAGKPILGQIDSKGLTNILIIVVRYFGGTLLGVPGLINAYKTAASLVIQVCPVVSKAIERAYTIQFDYTNMNSVMMVLKQAGCSIINQDIQLFCRINIGVPVNREEEVIYRLKDLRNVEIEKS